MKLEYGQFFRSLVLRVYLENISILAQIDLFREVDLVVAVHGAGLSNLAFADRPKVLRYFRQAIASGRNIFNLRHW